MKNDYRNQLDIILARENESIGFQKVLSQLIDLVEVMKSDGLSQLEVYSFFEERLVLAIDADNRYEDDLLTEILSFIWGWCPPEARLFPQSLTNGEVAAYKLALQQKESTQE